MTYYFVCKYVIGYEAESEDAAYDIAYQDLELTGGWNLEATRVRGV